VPHRPHFVMSASKTDAIALAEKASVDMLTRLIEKIEDMTVAGWLPQDNTTEVLTTVIQKLRDERGKSSLVIPNPDHLIRADEFASIFDIEYEDEDSVPSTTQPSVERQSQDEMEAFHTTLLGMVDVKRVDGNVLLSAFHPYLLPLSSEAGSDVRTAAAVSKGHMDFYCKRVVGQDLLGNTQLFSEKPTHPSLIITEDELHNQSRSMPSHPLAIESQRLKFDPASYYKTNYYTVPVIKQDRAWKNDINNTLGKSIFVDKPGALVKSVIPNSGTLPIPFLEWIERKAESIVTLPTSQRLLIMRNAMVSILLQTLSLMVSPIPTHPKNNKFLLIQLHPTHTHTHTGFVLEPPRRNCFLWLRNLGCVDM